jgi:spore photoproduct lyase
MNNQPHFSHLYIENQAFDFPDTDIVRKKFPQSEIVSIRDYRELFNRHQQHFRRQKRSMKLLLAVKDSPFIYSGSGFAPDFGHPHFYYNALMLNCVYDCDYCYLQGMFASANIVLFVNHESFFSAADSVLEDKGSLYLCISYDTDLLAFENIIPNCKRWLEWAAHRPRATIELRTKSANFSALEDIEATGNVILAWTLSPASIVRTYEKKTPPLEARLAAITNAIEAGWNVRLCFDPMLRVSRWRESYSELISTVFTTLPGDSLYDISIGVFRMNQDYLDNIQSLRDDSDILFSPFAKQDRSISYPANDARKMTDYLSTLISRYSPHTKVSIFN